MTQRWVRRVLLLLAAVAAAPAAADSPFYLTIERSFSPSETPAVRFDYRDPTPVRLTVLRPENLETFLEGQLAISRSYEEPLASLNPGHYMLKGMNKARSPLAALSHGLSSEFRKGLEGAYGSPLKTFLSPRVTAVPKEIQIGPPKGFKVEREFFIDLQAGDANKNNAVPGFETFGDWGGETSYKQRVLALEPLPDGVYLLQAVQGNNEAQALLQVSRHSVQIKQSSKQLLARVVDRAAQPVKGAQLAWRDRQGRWQPVPGETDGAGELLYQLADAADAHAGLPGRLVVKVTKGDVASVLIDTDFLPALANDRALYLMTDRPIFRPGDDVHFKGFVRRNEESGPAPVDGTPLATPKLSLFDQEGAKALDVTNVETSPFDSFSGSLTLGEDSEPGLYRVVAETEGSAYAGEMRVRNYVKPTFYLQMSEVQGTLRPGAKFSFQLQATRYSGGTPADTRYEVYVYRKKYSQPAFVEDAGKGLATGNNYFGQTEDAPSQPEKLYSTIDGRDVDSGADAWETAARFDAKGTAAVAIELPAAAGSGNLGNEEWIYTLDVRAKDGQGAFAGLTEDYYATSTEVVVAAAFGAPVAEVGQGGELGVRVTYPDGRTAPRAAGHVKFTLATVGQSDTGLGDVTFVTDEAGRALVQPPAIPGNGRLTAVAVVASYDGRQLAKPAESPATTMIVADRDGGAVVEASALEVYATSDVVDTQGKTAVLLILPKDWGEGESGTVWRTSAGAKVHGTEAIETKGRSLWVDIAGDAARGTGFYETFTVAMPGGRFSERTVGFRQIRKDRVLTVDVTPSQEVIAPHDEQVLSVVVTDDKGAPAADTELTIGVVDRAVYAVQPEFRPSIFDFFYPLPRLNLMTFYSDELQGYGYADEIRRPNFRLGALKAKLVPKDARDTAAWFPHVVTDAAGKAEVRFAMPGNLTEWQITVTAMDKSGRIGERLRRFRSGAEHGAFPRLARFLRAGDRLGVPVRLANSAGEAKTATVQLASVKGLELLGQTSQTATVGANGETTLFFEVRAGEAGADPAQLSASADFGDGAKALAEKVDILPASMLLRIAGNPVRSKELAQSVPAAGRVEEAQVHVSVGLLGAALAAGAELAVYPYGCTEQLTHTTVPNLVLLDILKRSAIGPDQLGPYAPLMETAQRHAAVGMKRLLSAQTQDGGFGAWPGAKEPSVGSTIVAMYGLKMAALLGDQRAEEGLRRAANFMRTQQTSELAYLDSVTPERSLLLASLVEIGAFGVRAPVETYLKNLADESAADLESLAAGLRILRANHANGGDANLKLDAAALEKDLISRTQAALASFDPEAYDRALVGTYYDGWLGYAATSPAAIAAAAGALREAKALPAELSSKVKSFLLARMRNGMWDSTFTTAQVLYSVRGLLEDEAQGIKSGTAPIKVALRDDSPLGDLTPVPGGYVGIFRGLAKNADLFPLLKLSSLPDSASAFAVLKVNVPNANVAAQSQGLQIDRGFIRVGPKGGEPLADLRSLRVGDVVISVVKVSRETVPNGIVPSRLIVVEDPIPSLAEAIDDDRPYLADVGIKGVNPASYWATVRQTYRAPERTTRVIDLKPGASTTVFSVWRVGYAGEAAVNGVTAFDMYDERLAGNTTATVAVASSSAAKP